LKSYCDDLVPSRLILWHSQNRLLQPLFMRLWRCGVKMRLWGEIAGKRGFEVL
jgi:hypothetical protein